MSEVDEAQKLEMLAVTMPKSEADEIRAEAKEKRWPITMVLRERLKDGKRWRESRKMVGG